MMKAKKRNPPELPPLDIAYHGIPPSGALSDRITREAEKLARLYPHIIFCRVVVDLPHHRHHRGNSFVIRVEIGVPNEVLMVEHQPSERRILDESEGSEAKRNEIKPDRKDPYVGVRHAFDAARKRLEKYVQHLKRKSPGGIKEFERARDERLAP